MAKYQVYSLDVWSGDEEGTWDINNFFKVGVIDIGEQDNDERVVEILIEEGFLKEAARGFINVQDHSDGWIYITGKTNDYPLYNLELITE